jgi:hypothetical protein
MDRDRVKLRVTPKTAIAINVPGLGNGPILCIEVLNLSAFPVTVTQVGFTLPGDQRLVLMDPIVSPEQTRLPKRLEPRTSITCYAAPGTEREPRFRQVKAAFASTDCQVTVRRRKRWLSKVARTGTLID